MLPYSEFEGERRVRDGRMAICRICLTLHRRPARLRRIFGLSLDDYERMLAEQGGVCALCGSPPGNDLRTRHLAVDHCHETGRIRGLLCGGCNRALGFFKDDPELLDRAAAYLRADGVNKREE
jgi:hypothetical protein